mmetsp:Transcript_31479/g.32677  ORF Transcript_31479/g.32677 Transcript_31479/m.32677 type:complete len:632 (-) Transcript_31479:23-1918(-)
MLSSQDKIDKITIGLGIGYAIFSLIAMILSIVAYAKSDDKIEIYESIINNHQRLLPSSIVQSPSDDIDYVAVTSFPGTKQGCDCSNKWLHFGDNVSTGLCSTKEDRQGCRDIYDIDSRTLHTWKGAGYLSFHRNVFSYMKNDYYGLIKEGYIFRGDCPTGKTKCGIIDTLNNLLCVGSGEECPINYMAVKDSNYKVRSDESYLDLRPQGQTPQKLIYSNAYTTRNIIVETRLSEDEICANPLEYKAKETDHVLVIEHDNRVDECDDLGNSIYTDSNFKEIDRYRKDYFYNDVGIYSSLDRIPDFNTNDLRSVYYRLSYKSYLGWDLNCVSDSESTDPYVLKEKYDSEDSNKSKLKAIMIMSIIYFVFSSYVMCCTFGKKSAKAGIVCITFLLLGLTLACAILSVKLTNILIDSDNYECTDTVTREVLRYINGQDNYNSALAVFHFLTSVIGIGMIVIACTVAEDKDSFPMHGSFDNNSQVILPDNIEGNNMNNVYDNSNNNNPYNQNLYNQSNHSNPKDMKNPYYNSSINNNNQGNVNNDGGIVLNNYDNMNRNTGNNNFNQPTNAPGNFDMNRNTVGAPGNDSEVEDINRVEDDKNAFSQNFVSEEKQDYPIKEDLNIENKEDNSKYRYD